MVDGQSLHFFIDYKSYTMVPVVAAPQDFLKVLLECEFKIEGDTYLEDRF